MVYDSGTFGLRSVGMHGKVSRSSQIRQAMASRDSCGQRETGKLLLTSVYILMNGESPRSNIVMYYSEEPEADLKWGGYGLLEVLWAPKAPPSGKFEI